MAQRNTNLRILSVAYANGRLTSDQYQTLRNQQLSAIEFNKAPPPIPPELNNIEIPTINVDPLRMQNTSRGGKRVLLGMAAALFLISTVLIAYMVWQHMPASESPQTTDSGAAQPKPIATASPVNAVTHNAMQLIRTGGEDRQALNEFKEQWRQLSDSEQNIQRQSPWAAELIRTLQQALRDSEPGARRQTTLRILDWLGAPLKEAPAPSAAEQGKETDSSTETEAKELEAAPGDDNGDETAAESESSVPAPDDGEQTDGETAADTEKEPEPSSASSESEAVAEENQRDDSDDASSSEGQESTSKSSEDKSEGEESAAEEEPPNPSDTGYDTTPEYEPEPEFGKKARDAILGDTPGY